MSSFDKNHLALTSQGITGFRSWLYQDTGDAADASEVSGYFTTGYDCGMRAGDFVIFRAAQKGSADNYGKTQWGGTVTVAQDTGATQVTLGLLVLIGDTS